MNYEELVKSGKNIGDMTKEELFEYCYGLLGEVWNFEKEIERLKTREKECMDKYLNMSKYASEMEGKYITEKYIIDELEKHCKSEINSTPTFSFDRYYTPGFNDGVKSVLNKLKELKEDSK